MNITELKKEGLLREFKAVFAGPDIEKAMQERLQLLSQKRKVPGFRAGKVPTDILRKKFGDEVKRDVVNDLLEKATHAIITGNKLRLALQPYSKIVKFDDQELECHIQCELVPEIKFPDFSKLDFEAYEPDVTEQDVQDAIKALQRELASIEEDTQAKVVEKDHIVVADLSFDIPEIKNGQATQKDVRMELGRNQVLAAIEEKVVGAQVGQTIQVDTIFPEYADPQLVGKKVHYDILLKKVLTRIPHPVDAKLAQKMGAESLEKLPERVKAILARDWGVHAFTLTKRALFDVLADAVKMDLPPTLVEQEKTNIQKTMEAESKDKKVTKEEEKQIAALANRRVKLGLFLSELSFKEKIDVKHEDIQTELMRKVQANPTRAKDILDYYKNTPGAIDQIRGPLLEDAIVSFIIQQAKPKTKLLKKDEINKRMSEV